MSLLEVPKLKKKKKIGEALFNLTFSAIGVGGAHVLYFQLGGCSVRKDLKPSILFFKFILLCLFTR